MQKLKTKITGLAFFLVIVCISCDKDDRLVGFVSMIALENNNICLVNCRAYDPAIDGVILDAFTIPHPSESYDPRDPNSEYLSNKVPMYIAENVEIIKYELE